MSTMTEKDLAEIEARCERFKLHGLSPIWVADTFAEQDIPALVADVRRLRQELAEANAEVRRLRGEIESWRSAYPMRGHNAILAEGQALGLDRCPCGGQLVVKDADWARCVDCGDDTFPLKDES
jgi:hypothetical protein